MKKAWKIAGILMLSIIIFAAAFVFHSRMFYSAPPRQGLREMIQSFETNREAIFTVRDYFANSKHETITSVGGQSGMVQMHGENTGFAGQAVIENEHAKEAMSLLIRDGYKQIRKWKGFITFTRWQRGSATVGVLYAADGSIPTPGTIYFLSKLEPLAYEGWYYFETNYNESRMPPSQGIDDMRAALEEDMQLLIIIRNYFANLDYDVLSYPIDFRVETNNRGVMYVGVPINNWESRRYMAISCESVNIALELLLLQGYMNISKNDGFLIFTRWARGGVGIGAVYSMDGTMPTSDALPYLTKLEISEEDGWFYYEVNSRNWPR